MKIDTFYGDSIFYHNEEDLDNSASYKDYEEFDRIFTECIDILEKDLALDEGTNIEIWSSFNSYKKAYRSALSKAHMCMRKKEWSESIQYLSNAKSAIKKCKEEVESTKSNITSAAFGILANSVLTMIMDTLPGMTYLIGIENDSAIGSEIRKAISLPTTSVNTIKGISKVSKVLLKNDSKTVKQIISAKLKCDELIKYAKGFKVVSISMTVLYAISHIIDDAYSIIKEFKEDENNEKLTGDKLNLYKNNIIKTLDKFDDTIEKEIKAVKEKQNKSRKS